MHTQTTLQAHDPITYPELDIESRSHRLRDMYWARTHEKARVRKPIRGCGDDSLVGHARDFAALLEASDPFIQEEELLVGVSLAIPQDKDGLNLGHYNSHYPPGHALTLRKGLPGIRDEAARRAEEETDSDALDFFRAVAISYQAAMGYVEKYAQYAENLASVTSDPIRESELKDIAGVCRSLTEGPPRSFRAALQLFQFVRVFGGRGCIGRFDQWMYPFYRQDMDAGRLTEREAQDLLEELFIKLSYFGDVNVGVNNDDLRNIALAGQTGEGKDACNELTFMCLEASAKLRLPEPKLNVRFFEGSPPELLQACCRVIAGGNNVLAIFNDEVVVPALGHLGIPIEDRRDYCNDGCSEIIIGGKGTIHFRVHHALPALTETVLEAETQPYASFEDVMADFKERLVRYMPENRDPNPPISFPFFAAGIEDCLAKGSPAGMRYSIAGSILAQVGDASDGLAAIQKLIFEDGVLAWEDLIAALKADYEGYEPLRQMIRNRAPKYGNDMDGVDEIAKEIAEYFCDGVHERAQNPEGVGNKRAAGLMCFGIHRAKDTPASPDGRRKGDFTANSFSPAVGMDRTGPTAVLKSASKVDLSKASHGSVLDMALHSSAVADHTSFEKFVSLIESFLTMGCTATLQMNIIDRDTLLKARENPDSPEFKTLVVRVWGFSAVFVELPTALQDHVLSRTEHGHN